MSLLDAIKSWRDGQQWEIAPTQPGKLQMARMSHCDSGEAGLGSSSVLHGYDLPPTNGRPSRWRLRNLNLYTVLDWLTSSKLNICLFNTAPTYFFIVWHDNYIQTQLVNDECLHNKNYVLCILLFVLCRVQIARLYGIENKTAAKKHI